MECRACGGADLDTVFHMDPMPLAGAFAETAEDAVNMERIPLEWRQCQQCGLVNVWPSVPEEVIFEHYSYRASDVPALVRHHKEFARWLGERWQPRLHVEIGGNDGVLLRNVPWPAINIDPSDAWVGPGYNEPFTPELARRLPKADLITSSNAMAHFDAIGDALAAVRYLLHRDGVFVMEVHDLDATLATGQWDTVYHEHRVEWSYRSLVVAGALHGLALRECYRLPLHGGLLRAVFTPDTPHVIREVERPDFAALQRAYDEAQAPELPDGSVAYGAAARATVYLDHVKPNICAVVDGSPRRIGRYMPGSGLQILNEYEFEFTDPPAALITAIGHEADIKAKHPTYGRWVEWRG